MIFADIETGFDICFLFIEWYYINVYYSYRLKILCYIILYDTKPVFYQTSIISLESTVSSHVFSAMPWLMRWCASTSKPTSFVRVFEIMPIMIWDVHGFKIQKKIHLEHVSQPLKETIWCVRAEDGVSKYK